MARETETLSSMEDAVPSTETDHLNATSYETQSQFQERSSYCISPPRGCKSTALLYFKIFVSILSHLGFIASVVVVVWSRRMDVTPTTDTDTGAHGSNRDIFYHCYLIASMLAGLFYILLLVEAAASDTYKYIRSYSSLQTAEEFADRVRDARPLVRWHAVCYHFEYRQAGHTSHLNVKGPPGANCRLSNGGPARGQIRYKEKVLTYRESEALKFNRWRDLTRDIKGFFSKSIVRFECTKVFIFKDNKSKKSYMEQYITFRDRNRKKDEFMEHDENFTIPGFQERLTVSTRRCKRPSWLRELWFWTASMLLMTWFYRWFFRIMTCKVYVFFVKELEV